MQPGIGASPSDLRVAAHNRTLPFGAFKFEFRIDCKNIQCIIVDKT